MLTTDEVITQNRSEQQNKKNQILIQSQLRQLRRRAHNDIIYFIFLFVRPDLLDGNLYFPLNWMIGKNVVPVMDRAALLASVTTGRLSHAVKMQADFPPLSQQHSTK